MTLNEDIQKILEEDVKIKTKNPGILEVPEGKNFWDLPLKHYKDIVDKKGYAKVIRALTNLEVWNKNDDPDISKKASKIADDLKKFYKKESLNEEKDDFMYTSSAISGVLTRKLDDLSLKINKAKKEIEEAFPDDTVDSKEKVKELREKYAELYSLISNAIKSIEELSNKLK